MNQEWISIRFPKPRISRRGQHVATLRGSMIMILTSKFHGRSQGLHYASFRPKAMVGLYFVRRWWHHKTFLLSFYFSKMYYFEYWIHTHFRLGNDVTCNTMAGRKRSNMVEVGERASGTIWMMDLRNEEEREGEGGGDIWEILWVGGSSLEHSEW